FISSSAANAVSGSVMVAYEADDMSGSLAADLVYVSGSVMTDVALTATYDAYTLDVYYATDATNGGYTATSNLLSAQVEGTIEDFTVTLAGLDLINTRDLSATVEYMVSDELAVSVDGSYTLVGGAWSAGADATYTTDAYELAFGGSYASTQKVTLDASIESSSIVPGATLALTYAADDVTAVDAASEDDGNLGSITASVEIAF
ncbi:MAG: hypothetical protein PQJ47_04800, partial [Sphaerochaetaceae bacterium]|nr:hypothetical protein [Sphaerochaetaceae bacterium]